MHIAIAVTLFFIAATSALGGVRGLQFAAATGRRNSFLGALVAFGMTCWCGYLGFWVLSH